MSLSERVQQAGNADVVVPKTDANLLDELRMQLRDAFSVDKLAKLAQTNPERARNEVRSACRRIFESPSWEPVEPQVERRIVEQLLNSIFGFGYVESLRQLVNFDLCTLSDDADGLVRHDVEGTSGFQFDEIIT